MAKPKTTKENIGRGNNLTILGQTAVLIARFCAVPQVKFDVFKQSKREEEKWISNKFSLFYQETVYVGSNRFSVGPSYMIAIINRLVNSV